MAKKSIDTKDPSARPHVWAREPRPDEVAEVPVVSDYPYQVPRLVHKDGDHLQVNTPDECDDALANGWSILPKAQDSAE